MADGYGNPAIDFSILGNLGAHYNEQQREARKERTLAELGKMLQGGGTINYNQLAGTLASLGDVGGALGAIKQKQTQDALGQFQSYLGSLYGGQPQGAAPPAGTPRAAAPPAGAPVRSTSTVMGDDEGVRAGLYDPPTTPGARPPIQSDAAPVMAPSPNGPGRMAPTFGAASPVVAPPPATPAETVAQRFPQQAGQPVRAPAPGVQGGLTIGRPNPVAANPAALAMLIAHLPEGAQKAGTALLEHALRASDPTEAIKTVNEVLSNPRRYGYTGPDDPRLLREVGYKISGVTAPGQAAESAFSTKLGTLQAERFNTYIKEGQEARTRGVDIGNLRGISHRIGAAGVSAPIREAIGPYATALGIKIDGLSDIQAYTSIVQRLAPQNRVTGSGSTSDIEYKGMLRSMPGLMLEPAAREVILDSLEALEHNDIKRGEIATRLATGEIDRVTAERELQSLGDPMKQFQEWRKANPALYANALRGGGATPGGPATSGGAAGGWRLVPQ